ncbi:MAG TPA: hypothetical protein VF169_22965 [Albitalea sp.]|uniref:hypothetical protein n=1 Tax=Piscinibacter sp. TaxID=1903157 RepID=UPI002ED61054
MSRFKNTAIASAAGLAFVLAPAQAQTVADLQAQIDALRKQLQVLIEQQQARPPADADQATRDAGTPATKADIQGVRADFENYKYENARQLERKVPSVTRNTSIGGTIQVRATWQNPVQNAGVANGATGGNTSYQATPRHTSFDIPSVTLSFGGNLFRDYKEGKNLTYSLGLASGSNFAGSPQSTSSADRTLGVASANGSQLNVTNANLAYSFFPTNGGLEDPKGTLTAGQQLMPFGLEAQANEEIRPVINSAQFTSALSGINTRQIGLVYRGDSFVNVDYTNNYRSTLIEYALGVVNGSGPNKSDNNGKKDWLGRLAFTLPADYTSWLRELRLGLSYYRGYNNLANTTTNAVVQIGRSTRAGFDLNYTHLPISITYEFVQGKDDTFAGPAALAAGSSPTFVKTARGQYLNIGYTWGEQFLASEKSLAKYDDYWPKSYQAFVRFDSFDADTLNDAALRAASVGDKTFITTLGLNAFFAETTKFQVNYLLARNDVPATGVSTADRPRRQQGLQVQFQYGF